MSDGMASDSDMTCEAHPLRVWPHDDCIGPGMPYGASLGWIREQCGRVEWCITHGSRKHRGKGRLLGWCESRHLIDPNGNPGLCEFVTMILVPGPALGEG